MTPIHAKMKVENGVLRLIDPVSLPFADGEEIEVEIVGSSGAIGCGRAAGSLQRQKEAIRQVSGIIDDDGPPDWSTRHDQILYNLTRRHEPNAR